MKREIELIIKVKAQIEETEDDFIISFPDFISKSSKWKISF